MLREPRVLDSEIVPDHELSQHRGSEIETLLDGLHPDRDLPPRPVAITGPSGTGKSHVAQTALQKLRDLADALGVCTVHRSSQRGRNPEWD